MYKFKFDPPQEHRRSLQVPKNEHMPFLLTLDKCTQILRQDRLWLRNQIKSQNQQVISIFKQFPRSTQLSNLQVKLRKYLQTVKNKIKQEQLDKFRQTLHTGQQHLITEAKPPSQPKRINHSNSKQHFKSSSSLQLSKTTNFRHNKSQQHTNSQLKMTTSFRHFQDLLKYKCNQQVIEERQSQNVTSARLGRQQNDHSRPLQQLPKDHFNHTISHNFYAIKSQNNNQNNSDASSWHFQQKAKQVLYQYKPSPRQQPKDQQIQQINKGLESRFKKDHDQKEDSIFDRHFNQSERDSARHEDGDVNSTNNEHKSNIFGQNVTQSVKSVSQSVKSMSQSVKQGERQCYSQPFELKQSTFNSTYEAKPITKPQEYNYNNDENLFTPLELLNECRNFLKNRDSSTKKQEFNTHFQDFLKNQTLKPISLPSQKVPSAEECLFSRDNHQDPQMNQDSMEEKKEEQSYSFPEIRASFEQSQVNTSKKEEHVNYTNFETFANCSNQKITFEKPLSPPQLPTLSLPKPKETFLTLPLNFSIEIIIQDLMEISEMNPFITVSNLKQYISTHHSQQKALSSVLKSFMSMSNDNEVCLTAIADQLDRTYRLQNQKSYPHSDSSINSVYDLLDIDQKGFICREDIDSFLGQIQQAEIENYDEVSSELIRLFQGADFANQQKLTYWHFYLVKNSEQFERVSQLLGQFQFQIERTS